MSWAFPLKEHIGIGLFGFSGPQVFGTEADKEAIDPRWGVSPRHVLQYFGTEVFRNFDPDFWVKVGMQRIEKMRSQDPNCRIVVSDCRFPNEMDAIKQLGGYAVRVRRLGQISTDAHASETALDDYGKFDFLLNAREGDLAGLKNAAYDLVLRVEGDRNGIH